MKLFSLFFAASLFTIAGCKKDKSPKNTIPELSTAAITNIGGNKATAGGTITSNGGETITASGVCWSSTNQNPTIADDTTKGNTASGSFTVALTDLNSSSTYYVRAYAINRNGTGYGDVVSFTTGNGAPVATDVTITGTPKGDELLTGEYTYGDAEGDAELESTFQWYMADDANGTGETPIEDATEKTFRVQGSQEGKYIRFGVTPKAATGSKDGDEVKSAFIGAVGEAVTVTFMYNEQEVTYGIILGPSGKKWLDRNLGATRVATAIDDYQAYGDLFQWGRGADGHQLVTRANGTNEGITAVNGATSDVEPYETSDDDTPETNKFIINGDFASRDWRTTPNDNLWQGAEGINNPCPTGWRIPTLEEWMAENLSTPENAFTAMKLTRTGRRVSTDGTFLFAGEIGFYWSSTPNVAERRAYYLNLGETLIVDETIHNTRATGQAVRCIKD